MAISYYFIDIPYRDLKKATEKIEKKVGICDHLPCGRFRFDFIKTWSEEHLNHMGRITNNDGSNIRFELICCDGEKMGGNSTGTAAEHCRNCVTERCKHKNTREVKCDRVGCEIDKHIECLDCGVFVDLLEADEENKKELLEAAKMLRDNLVIK